MIRDELETHIYELMEEKNTAEQAIEKMGDAITLGQSLNKVYKPSFDFMLLALGGLIIIGSLFIWSSLNKNNIINNLHEGIISLIIGSIIGSLLVFSDYRILNQKDTLIFGIGGFINITTFIISSKYDLILLSILAYIVSISSIVNKYNYNYKSIGMMLISIVLVIKSSFTYAFLLIAIYIILFIINSINKKSNLKTIIKNINISFTLIIISLILGFGIIYYKTDKVNAFLNPEVNSNGEGWEYVQSRYILDNSKREYSQNNDIISNCYLGELEQQNIFIYILGKFGIYILVGILLVIYLIIGKIIKNIIEIKEGFGRNMMVCFASLFIIEFILNILKSMQLIPKISINLPFLSLENMNIIISVIILTLSISIYKLKKIA